MGFILLIAIIALSVIIILFVVVGCKSAPENISDPLLAESTEHIMEALLELMPTDTSMDDVIKTIAEKEDWKVFHIDWIPWSAIPDYYVLQYVDELVERKSIRVMIGEYKNKKIYGFTTAVVADLKFDEDLKLVDIDVGKYTDGL